MKSLVIIPAFNEANSVPGLVKELNKYGYDYIVLNDCSTDNSIEVYDKNKINYLNLPLNMGLASVTQAGFRYAKEHDYDCAIVIDGDGQHPPFNIERLFKEIENGNDYVIGSRFVEKDKSWSLRMVGSRIICFFIFLKTGKRVSDPTSGMRCLNRNVINEFVNDMNYIAEPDALTYLIKRKYKVKEVQVEMDERENGESYFKNPLRAIKFVFNVVVSILFI